MVLDKHRDWNVADFEWWEFVYEDATAIGALMGIEIEKIWFSGFWSQGDGACFIGRYAYRPGSVKAVKEYAPKDTELHTIAKDLQTVQQKAQYQLSATIEKNHYVRYEHENSVTVNVSHDLDYEFDQNVVEGITEALRDFMRWVYRSLEREYEYLTSDEVVRESIEMNEMLFRENGVAE
jgi:hypothetical protein